MKKQLCGADTPNGPCTLPKDHQVNYHRHRLYQQVTWEIETPDGVVLEEGSARVPMNYAITRCLEDNENLIVRLRKWEDGTGVDQTEH